MGFEGGPLLKLLFLDIETSPLVAMLWGTRNQDVSIDQIKTPTSILCVGYAIDGGPVQVVDAGGKLSGPWFNKMIRKAHELLSTCDAVCHFNGATFDVPRLNAEFLKLGLKPPPPIPQIDLKKVAMSKFGTTSSKLAFLGPYLGLGEKEKNDGWALWDGCLKGDIESWRKMRSYNTQDIVLLRKLYKRLLPWIDNHPNLAIDSLAIICPNCASPKVQSRGYKMGATMLYRQYQCQGPDCGRWFRKRTAEKGVKAEVR